MLKLRLYFSCVGIFFCLTLQPLLADEYEGVTYLTPLSFGPLCGDITFKPGLRIQTRYRYDDAIRNNDFFIRRFRLKASGMVFDLAKYGAELKIDNVRRHGKDPKAEVENAWVDFPVCDEFVYIRVGLYDLPFSRNALTSDSKLLFMDRTLIKFALTDFGLADNTIGILMHGRPYQGLLEYAFGIFDNDKFEKIGSQGEKHSGQLMPAGRIVLNVLDPSTPPDGYADYKESYLCEGQRLAIGVNAAYLGSAEDGQERFDLFACGTDLFFNYGPYTFQAEYDWYKEDDKGYGWYVQGGYLFSCCCYPLEVAARYETLDPVSRSDRRKTQLASAGLNVYIREHHLKVQSDYTYKKERHTRDHDAFQIQLQFDY